MVRSEVRYKKEGRVVTRERRRLTADGQQIRRKPMFSRMAQCLFFLTLGALSKSEEALF